EMPVATRLGLVVLGFFVVVAIVIFWAAAFLRTGPATVPAARVVETSSGPQAYLTLQTVGAIGSGPRPTWVSYLVKDASGKWVHSTVFQLPAHATIHVTVLQYDSAGSLRNPEWSQVQGTIGGTATYTGTVGSKTYTTATPLSHLGASDAGHTFSVPALGVNVPLAGLPNNAKNVCSAAPCAPSMTHDVVQFSFRTRAPHVYHWQCFIPCGLGFVNGNGGPMQTIGYMSGFLKV
ncbi:MAG: hypothetical protein ACYCV7_04860, partial [Acidimicrobiales bacterium]